MVWWKSCRLDNGYAFFSMHVVLRVRLFALAFFAIELGKASARAFGVARARVDHGVFCDPIGFTEAEWDGGPNSADPDVANAVRRFAVRGSFHDRAIDSSMVFASISRPFSLSALFIVEHGFTHRARVISFPF